MTAQAGRTITVYYNDPDSALKEWSKYEVRARSQASPEHRTVIRTPPDSLRYGDALRVDFCPDRIRDVCAALGPGGAWFVPPEPSPHVELRVRQAAASGDGGGYEVAIRWK